MKKPIEEVVEIAMIDINSVKFSKYGTDFRNAAGLSMVDLPKYEEMSESEWQMNKEIVAHALRNFKPLLDALKRCEESLCNDNWGGPLKSQIRDAIENASFAEVTD